MEVEGQIGGVWKERKKTMEEEGRSETRAQEKEERSVQFLIRKEGGCVWLRGNKVVFDNL